MGMVVKNNMSAVRTLSILNQNSTALQKSLSKVASGMKINSAQDDAAGYAISERMRVRIRSLDQANQNSQNDSSLMKTAEGAVSNTIELLKALKEKAINAANDSNTDEDRQTIQKELDQFIDQIDDNALVQFNGKYLVDAHSTTGDTGASTSVDTVNITVSGGSVTDNIYARGQVSGDTVTGTSTVKFEGSTDYSCNVYGYDYVPVSGSALTSTGTSDLEFSDYTGTISGDIGGFDAIAFTGDARTALTGTVANGMWAFDLTDRSASNASYAMLDWSGSGEGANHVAVTFSDSTQAKGGWSIASVADFGAGTTFDLTVGGTSIVTGLAYNTRIGSGTYADWGFKLDGGVLKFANLA
ncbi:MAG: flagellin [Thermoguttaceae bacterium]|nr:flagellin [Thermoguttaceae bacterium]